MTGRDDDRVFGIDHERYRVVDISNQVEPNECDAVRPFSARRSDTLPDGKDTEVVQTHTHVGTHVETALHFFREGKSVSDFPLSTFMGQACVLSVDDKEEGDLKMDREYLAGKFGEEIEENDIVVCRNDSMTTEAGVPHPDKDLPYFTPGAGNYFVDKGVKMMVIGGVKFGEDIEIGKEFEGKLHAADIPILESPAHLHDLKRKRFFLMALPYSVAGLGSAWTRAIVIERR